MPNIPGGTAVFRALGKVDARKLTPADMAILDRLRQVISNRLSIMRAHRAGKLPVIQTRQFLDRVDSILGRAATRGSVLAAADKARQARRL